MAQKYIEWVTEGKCSYPNCDTDPMKYDWLISQVRFSNCVDCGNQFCQLHSGPSTRKDNLSKCVTCSPPSTHPVIFNA